MEVDEFSDDGFDDLPDNALQELERNAIQLTQAHAKRPPAPRAAASQRPSRLSDYGWEEEDDDLDTTEVTNDAGVPVGRPVVDNTLRQQLPLQQPREAGITASSHASRRPAPPLPNPRWNPAVDHPKMAAAAAAGSGLHSRAPGLAPPGVSLSASQMHPFPAHDAQYTRPLLPENRRAHASQAPQASQASHSSQVGAAGDVLSALQRRVRVLESELHAARGEASIIRAKSLKAQQEYDGHIERLQKLNAEQLEKQTRMVEAAVAAEKSANTELQFLQQDMREVHGRARRRDASGGGGVTTPRKGAKSRGFADGFDEMDVALALSPTKGQGRGKSSGSVAATVGERTPSKGKRKRPTADSPVPALETTNDVVMSDDHGQELPAVSVPVPAPMPAPSASAAPFEFLQLVLDHGTFHQQPPTFDTLSRFTFSSEPERTFSSMIFEKLPLMGNPHRPMQLLVDFAELIVSLWARCVDEEVWEPVKYLVALISFTLDLHTTSVAPLIVPNCVPVALATLFTVADARRRLPDGSLANSPEYGFYEERIDTGQLLSLLYVLATSCSMAPTEAENGFAFTSVGFWRLVSLDMVLLLLTPKQKPSDVIGMLDLLATSVLPASIGPVSADTDVCDIAKATIERVSAKLTEQGRIPMTPGQRRSIRLAALRTLIAFSTSPFGALELASHGNAIPRLVHCLSAAIDELYDQPIPPSVLPPLSESLGSALRPHESTASADLYLVISQSVLLVHRLVTHPATANLAEVPQKLSMSHGGSQRYLLSLGRLAFAEEDLVIEAGIEGEVVEAAHELLELAVTPDEGETISAAFGA
ncbi:hypothetical protein E4U42_005839 [Claviceps africana]|uniref:DNA repair protein Rad26 n=1 Tax=Claviceps africana TaxID=83212 RepID=A0A8K0J3R0_9HYPO|nr:hypothetical protein E4U42_005839 [Claviceps africana]